MATSEKPIVDAVLLAISHLNAQGGLLGKLIEPIIVDGMSNPKIFARQAEKLTTHHNVQVIFGCWTSSSRKSVKPIVEKNNGLLFYPVQYEGLEESPNIVYIGATPHQQIIPGISWLLAHRNAKRFFIVGSDYIFPRAAHEIIKAFLAHTKGSIVGSAYIPLGSHNVTAMIEQIKQATPDIILNTINGDSNVTFFHELRKAGISSQQLPTMSFSITESELPRIGIKNVVGDYATWSYFQNIHSKKNNDFVRQIQKKYGTHHTMDDPGQASYFGVQLWAQAVKKAQSTAITHVKKALRNQSINAPEGVVYLDEKQLHAWRTIRIGQIGHDGQFNIVWNSGKPIAPRPYPIYKTKTEWDRFLLTLYNNWGQRWEKP